MFTIKEAAARVGVEPATLRAWEQRYGVVSPQRSQAGYRVYGDADLRVLRTMSSLIQEGWSAAQAAEQALKVEAEGDRTPLDAQPDASVHEVVGDPEVLVDCGARFDGALLTRALDDAFGRASFEAVATQWLLPGLEALGRAWADGTMSIAGEHFVTAAVQRRLGMAYEAAGNAPAGPLVLVGLPADSRHELGVLTFATLLRRQGVRTRYVGADLPAEAWLDAVEDMAPAAVVLGVPMDADVRTVEQTVDVLRQARPDLGIFVGGALQGAVSGAEALGGDLLAAADHLRQRLEQTSLASA